MPLFRVPRWRRRPALVGVSPDELVENVKDKARATIARQVLVFLLGLERKDKTLLEMWMQGGSTRGVNLDLRLEARHPGRRCAGRVSSSRP